MKSSVLYDLRENNFRFFLFLFNIYNEPVLLLTQHVNLYPRTVSQRLVVIQAVCDYSEGRTDKKVSSSRDMSIIQIEK